VTDDGAYDILRETAKVSSRFDPIQGMSEQVRLQYHEILRRDGAARLRRGVPAWVGRGYLVVVLDDGRVRPRAFRGFLAGDQAAVIRDGPRRLGRCATGCGPLPTRWPCRSLARHWLSCYRFRSRCCRPQHERRCIGVSRRAAALNLLRSVPNSSWDHLSSPWWIWVRSPACSPSPAFDRHGGQVFRREHRARRCRSRSKAARAAGSNAVPGDLARV